MSMDEIEQKIKASSGIKIENVEHNGQEIVLHSDEFQIESNPLENLAVLEEDEYIVALNTKLSKSLIQEGIAREFIRHIQNIRKESQFDVLDRIVVQCTVSEEMKAAINEHKDYIKKEILAEDLIFDGEKKAEDKIKISNEEIWININKV